MKNNINCKVCNSKLNIKPILVLKNMPAQAQKLPDKKNLRKDKGEDLKLYQCNGCGLIQLNVKPVSYYKEVIRATGLSQEMRDFRSQQFEEFIGKYNLKNKKIIEIGCGGGEYLAILNQNEIKAQGLEYSLNSVKICKKNNLNVVKGYVDKENFKIKNSPFDAFLILSFLEHFPNPNLALKGIAKNLIDEGIGIVEVPNFDMILRKYLFSEFISDHLFYFTKDTLETTLKINGFEILEIKEIWHDYIISAIVKKRKKLDLSNFKITQRNMQVEVNEFLNKFSNKKVAIWGAGHQALALISLLNISSKIKYVIDSAPFKQGRYTPATHLPIVSPEVLEDGDVEAIIIMAASYSDEVFKIIKEKYGNKYEVKIIGDRSS